AVERARGRLGAIRRLDLAGEQAGAVAHQAAVLHDGAEERRQLAGELGEVDVLAGLEPVDHPEVGRERQAAVDHVLLEDPLEAAGDHELDAGALVGDHGDLAAAAGAVGVAADDDLEAAALDAVLLDLLLEVLEEVGPEDLAGVAERAGG